MTNEALLLLLEKYESGTCTDEESAALDRWFNAHVQGEEAYALNKINEVAVTEHKLMEFRQMLEQKKSKAVKRYRLKRWSIAATVALLLGASGYYFLYSSHKSNNTTDALAADIAPGHDGAILTLSNGQKIVLDSTGNGTIARQGNAEIINNHGELAYLDKKQQTINGVTYNILSTPTGRQYKIVLPDGTQVWLNAASSIRYPTTFTDKERLVELTGEAYFKVVHNPNQPFEVKAGNRTIEDIGTVFDVSAYADDKEVKTTLLEGAVKVDGILLHPGEQAQANALGKIHIAEHVDTQQATAWQMGMFEFDNTGLDAIMRQISRWYDVDIVYTKPPGNDVFGGGINKKQPLSDVLKLLEANGVHFDLRGKTLFVTP